MNVASDTLAVPSGGWGARRAGGAAVAFMGVVLWAISLLCAAWMIMALVLMVPKFDSLSREFAMANDPNARAVFGASRWITGEAGGVVPGYVVVVPLVIVLSAVAAYLLTRPRCRVFAMALLAATSLFGLIGCFFVRGIMLATVSGLVNSLQP